MSKHFTNSPYSFVLTALLSQWHALQVHFLSLPAGVDYIKRTFDLGKVQHKASLMLDSSRVYHKRN